MISRPLHVRRRPALAPLVLTGAAIATATVVACALGRAEPLTAAALVFAAMLAIRTGVHEPEAPSGALGDAAAAGLLLFFATPGFSAILPETLRTVILPLPWSGGVFALALYMMAGAISSAVRARGLDSVEQLGFLTVILAVTSVLALGRPPFSDDAVLRGLLLFAVAELVTGMVGLVLRRHWPRAPALHLTLAVSAALAASGRPVADLPALVGPAMLAVPVAIAAAAIAQASLWSFVYLMTGVLLDGLSGRAPVAPALIAHARTGFAKGAIFGAAFMAIVLAAAHALNAGVTHPPMLWSAGVGALLFPLARTILESSDETAPFLGRLSASYRDARAYARGAVAGAILGWLLDLGLPSAGVGERFAAMFALGALAFGGVDFLADLLAIARGRRQRLQRPAVYLLGLVLGGMLAGAVGWYFDQSQLDVVMAKIASYGVLHHDNPAPYAFQVFFNKWGTVDLGPVTGGVRLFYDESLSGVINWSIAAPLFSLNMVALEALFRRNLDPVRALVRPDGVRGVVEQTVRVLRWGLWMAPIIFTCLRLSPDPSWYNQDGLVRTVMATGASLTLPPDDFRAWSLAVFTGLLAYDWLRVLIWFDHMGLRVATLVNLSFVGGDRLDEWAGRLVGHTATTRVIPPAIRRFMTWAPLIIPFYIPRGSDWDTAWTSAERLSTTAQALPAPVTQLGLAYAVAGFLMLAGVVWLGVRLKRGQPLPEDHRHVLSNGLYEVVIADDGRTHGRLTRAARGAPGIDLSRPVDDPLDPTARGFVLIDRDGAIPPRALSRTRDGASLCWQGVDSLEASQRIDGIDVTIAVTLADERALEVRTVRLTNAGIRPRSLRLVSHQTLVLNESGAWHRDGPFNALHVETRFCKPLNALIARNALLSLPGARVSREVAFHAVAPAPGTEVTGFEDSTEQLNRLLPRGALRAATEAGWLNTFNPCAALAVDLTLEPRESIAIRFLDGHAPSAEAAKGIIARALGLEPPAETAEPEPRVLPVDARAAFHRFTQEGHLVTAGVRARPWAHVMANSLGYGVVADSAGYVASFSANARHHTLTPFRFEGFPASAPGQVVAIRDLDTGDTACLLPLAGTPRSSFAPGTATLNGEAAGIAFATEIAVLPDVRGEVRRLTLRDTAGRARRLRLSLHMTMVLAEFPAESAGRLLAEEDPASGALLFANPDNPFAKGFAVVACDLDDARRETSHARFMGSGGMTMPAMLLTGEPDAAVRDDGRRVAAFVGDLSIAPHGQREVVLVMGHVTNRDEAALFVRQHLRRETVRKATAVTRRHWEELLSRVVVETDDPAFDRLVNVWLPYQVLASRLWGRTGASQRGGAYGFRDQLQDVEPVTLIDPQIARRQLVLASGQQFAKGDVLKWWHADDSGRTLFGQRTRASDPHLWLPHAVIAYVRATGDSSVLDEVTPFLEGPPILRGEEGVFFSPRPSRDSATVRDHCRLALDLALNGIGPRGLPLLGSGDWDDGYDAAGRKGRGESVWMAFFLHRLLRDGALFSPADAARYDAAAARLRDAVGQAWTGKHYVRAYDDDGCPFGGIHALTAAWPALSGAAPFDQALTAAEAGYAALAEPRLVRLLTPPYTLDADPWPGRVARYPEGVRENGGQYSHGASWLVDAFAALSREAGAHGDHGQAERLMNLAAEAWWRISPLSRLEPDDLARLALPPHQQPADVYAGAPHDGRGGWAWYTGSAARMLTAAYALLGITMREGIPSAEEVPDNRRFRPRSIRFRPRADWRGS